jgi:hypothetical protein
MAMQGLVRRLSEMHAGDPASIAPAHMRDPPATKQNDAGTFSLTPTIVRTLESFAQVNGSLPNVAIQWSNHSNLLTTNAPFCESRGVAIGTISSSRA